VHGYASDGRGRVATLTTEHHKEDPVPYALDPELLQAVTAMLAGGATLPEPATRDDWKTLRANGEAGLARLEAALPVHPSASRTDHHATSQDGGRVPARWYAPPGHDPSAAG
jgi:hypothetical protein